MQVGRIKKRMGHWLSFWTKKKVSVEQEPEPVISAAANSGHTESFNRILLLWLDLQRAMEIQRRTQNEPSLVPWMCEDDEVRRLWEKITRPQNSCALTEWLYQSASGEIESWAQQALRECQLRAAKARI